jgi:1-acyl-sn-glycerol-3-phosphate acyltransferase
MSVQGLAERTTFPDYWAINKQKRLVSEKIWYWFGVSVVNLFARMKLDMDVAWHTPMPHGPKILAANHPTTVDPFLIMTLVPEQISILVTEGAFKVPLIGGCIQRGGHIPVVPGEGGKVFEKARKVLASGRTIGIFPEGSLSVLGGKRPKPRTGAARLALISGAPVIPIGIALDYDRIRFVDLPENGNNVEARFYTRGPYTVSVGEPMWFKGDVEDRQLVRATAEQIMDQILLLSMP